MIETEFQTALVKAARAKGGYAFKMSNRFLVGVLDLFVKLPRHPVALIECKMGHVKVNGETNIDLTPLQRQNIRDMQAAKGAAGWCVCCPSPDHASGHVLLVGTSHHADRASQNFPRLRRERGEEWPVEEIVRRIVNGQA